MMISPLFADNWAKPIKFNSRTSGIIVEFIQQLVCLSGYKNRFPFSDETMSLFKKQTRFRRCRTILYYAHPNDLFANSWVKNGLVVKFVLCVRV